MLKRNQNQVRKWQPVVDNMFPNMKYIVPFIVEEVAYQLELKSHDENAKYFLNNNSLNSKLPVFAENIKTYIEKTIPYYFIEDITVALNPFSGELVYKYEDNYLDVKSLQKKRIKQYLKDIDFNNVIDKLYDKDPIIFLRKLKLDNIKKI